MAFLTGKKNAVNKKTGVEEWLFSDKPEKFIKHCLTLNISPGDCKYNIDFISGWRQGKLNKGISTYLFLSEFLSYQKKKKSKWKF
jgi:hypothetical protein